MVGSRILDTPKKGIRNMNRIGFLKELPELDTSKINDTAAALTWLINNYC